MRRHAQRAADVGAERHRPEAGGERRREPPDEPPGVRPRSHGLLVVRRSRCSSASRRGWIGTLVLPRMTAPAALRRVTATASSCRHPALERRYAPGRRQAGDVEGFLDHHRHAEQRPSLAARQRRVGRLGGLAGAVEVAHHDGVELLIERLDARDDVVGELDGGNLPRPQRSDKVLGGAIVPLARGLSSRPVRPGIARNCAGGGDRAGREQKIAAALIVHESNPSVVAWPASYAAASSGIQISMPPRPVCGLNVSKWRSRPGPSAALWM